MREYRRKQTERAKLKLTRDADGRLRAANSDDINDIWAEQRRIRLAEAIEDDKRRAEKKAQRKEKVAKLKSWRVPSGSQAKEFVVNISLPKVKVPRALPARLKRVSRRRLLAGVIVLAILALSAIGSTMYGGEKANKLASNKGGVLDAAAGDEPGYRTVLPMGKSIEDLGGWARVSPPDKDPVFAFADSVGQAQITVSEQPLPASFSKDVAGSVKDLAKQFGANEQIDAGGTTAFIGTSIKGPQSVIFSTRGLLILIKSDAKVKNELWVDYVKSMQ